LLYNISYFPESALSQLASLGIKPSRILKVEQDERDVLELPKECYKNKELFVKLVKLAHESN